LRDAFDAPPEIVGRIAHYADSSMIAEGAFGFHRGTQCALSELPRFNNPALFVDY